MNNLKELTQKEHRNAERTSFMSKMIKRQITPEQYYVYLKNQFMAYSVLEYYAAEKNIFNGDMEKIKRNVALSNDILEMEANNDFPESPIFPATYEYVEHMKSIQEDEDKLLSHVYVRHMGDLSGGQIIKKLIPGPTRLYEFDGEPQELKDMVRNVLHDGLEEEAKVCFTMVHKFLEELEDYFENMGKADTPV